MNLKFAFPLPKRKKIICEIVLQRKEIFLKAFCGWEESADSHDVTGILSLNSIEALYY